MKLKIQKSTITPNYYCSWLNEETDQLSLPSYLAHYEENLDIVDSNRSLLKQHADIVYFAVEQIEANGPPVHAFDDIAPNTIQEHDENVQPEEDKMFAILNSDEVLPTRTPLSDITVAASNRTSLLKIRPGYWT
ncbi:hypothetical protein DPMN_113014 [Dreissena polymorpha]|uniref:Uncharacterized protein n=1 Tax=Dreissena polymorpha TaxID=45954 RepID=A0A9D4QR70_DREPO|nr:hypothetical protein DPMN_113014 [Dreissena polymorpha]